MGLPGAESKATRPLAQDFGEAHRRHSGTNGEPPGLAFGKPEDRLREAVRIRNPFRDGNGLCFAELT